VIDWLLEHSFEPFPESAERIVLDRATLDRERRPMERKRGVKGIIGSAALVRIEADIDAGRLTREHLEAITGKEFGARYGLKSEMARTLKNRALELAGRASRRIRGKR
jgi:hypothetical protein